MGGSHLPDGLQNPLWGTDIGSPPKKMMTIFEAVRGSLGLVRVPSTPPSPSP